MSEIAIAIPLAHQPNIDVILSVIHLSYYLLHHSILVMYAFVIELGYHWFKSTSIFLDGFEISSNKIKLIA